MNNKIISFVSITIGFLICFIIIPLISSNSPFPGIWNIFKQLNSDSSAKDILPALGETFIRFISAAIIGALFGIFVGIIQAQFKWIKAIVSPWTDIFRVTPAIVWISLFYALNFQPEDYLPFFNIPFILGAFFSSLYVSIHVEESIRNISQEEITYMHAQGVFHNFNWKVEYCYLPRIIAALTTGMKIGGSISLILVIVAEALLSTQDSLGRLLVGFQTNRKVELLWVIIISLSFLSLSFFTLFNNLEKLIKGEKK